MRIEGGFVGDHHIRARGDGFLQYFEGRHHGGRDAMNWGPAVSGNDAVDGVIKPWCANVILDPLNNFITGKRRRSGSLRQGKGGSRQGDASKNKATARYVVVSHVGPEARS